MRLFFNTERNGYSVEQCGGSITVGELVEYLEQYEDDTEIFFRNDKGYTYGSWDEDYITDETNESEHDETW